MQKAALPNASQLGVRVSDSMLARVVAASARAGIGRAEYVRGAILARVERDEATARVSNAPAQVGAP